MSVCEHADLFGNIMPMDVLEAVETFESRKSDILSHELGRLRDATRALNSLVIHWLFDSLIHSFIYWFIGLCIY